MSDTIPPRSYVEGNAASEEEVAVLRNSPYDEHSSFHEPWFTEIAADQVPPLEDTCGLEYLYSTGSFQEANLVVSDANSSVGIVSVTQSIMPSWLEAGNSDSNNVSIQLENPEPLQDIGLHLGEPLGDTSFSAFDLGTTEFTYGDGEAVIPSLHTVDTQDYYDTFPLDTKIELAESKDFWFVRNGDSFTCSICGTNISRPDNFGRHLKSKKCKAAWEHL
ncbi:uncharacterized protein CTRU02_200763 [Colletotrichum truncatum]|uniref:Uncharacterized protein n=1 Tax=Colletotrichum truncatum TaxID=5467 RepID=A0ACC3ZG26_COLTU|nr:uncharacterized protein CTRU02_00530 [Colletotrichum truncatum]KAF6801781.1 hypothetical protein CTRU02_00530 [Colletotrichum truncatum]